MISNDYVFAQSYEYYDRYHRMKDGKVIYDECFPHNYKEENIKINQDYRWWTNLEEEQIFTLIAQNKTLSEIIKEFKGNRTDRAIEHKVNQIRKEIERMRGINTNE
jgi:hypothetical protein